MEELIGFFLSKETLVVTDTSESWPQSFPIPLLKRFEGHDQEIRHPTYIGGGQEGTIFKFKYHKKELCLKLFKPWKYIGIIRIDDTNQKLLSPFSHECRAFARLCDVHQNGTFAVRCYGWIYLTDGQLAVLKNVDGMPTDYTRWAIVKEFIPEGPGLADIPTICSKMEIARRAMLLPGDVESKNYRRSFFVDLGATRTLPYPRCFWSEFEFNHFYNLGYQGLKNPAWLD